MNQLGAFLISGSLTIDEVRPRLPDARSCPTLTPPDPPTQYHHWYDVVAGGCIGSLSALAAYRMSCVASSHSASQTRLTLAPLAPRARHSYAAIWDFRFNHLPLPRAPPLATHSHGPDSASASASVASRRFPYTTESVGGVQPWAGQWRGERGTATLVAGAPGDAVKQRGGFASGGVGAGAGAGVGAAGMV